MLGRARCRPVALAQLGGLPQRAPRDAGPGPLTGISPAVVRSRQPALASWVGAGGTLRAATAVITCLPVSTVYSLTWNVGDRRRSLPAPASHRQHRIGGLAGTGVGSGSAARPPQASRTRPRRGRAGRRRGEVGGHDRVEFRSQPGRIGADLLGEPAESNARPARCCSWRCSRTRGSTTRSPSTSSRPGTCRAGRHHRAAGAAVHERLRSLARCAGVPDRGPRRREDLCAVRALPHRRQPVHAVQRPRRPRAVRAESVAARRRGAPDPEG
jgi:hypothetical protein